MCELELRSTTPASTEPKRGGFISPRKALNWWNLDLLDNKQEVFVIEGVIKGYRFSHAFM